ncbi:hypothetical protein L2746_19495 [Shewanella psychromarinicola]|nr:hypothetical protein [Shewanella psychromarinicola]
MLRNSIFQCYTLSDSRQLFEHPGLNELDIIAVDQQMPEVTGTEILLQLQQQLPRIKRVLISGDPYSAQGLISTTIIDATLQKPFTKVLLLDCLLTLI